MTNASRSFSSPAFLAPFPGQHWKEQASCNARTSQELITEGKKESNILAKRKHRRKSQLNGVKTMVLFTSQQQTLHVTALILLDRQSQQGLGEMQLRFIAKWRQLSKQEAPSAGRGHRHRRDALNNSKRYSPRCVWKQWVFLTEVTQIHEGLW